MSFQNHEEAVGRALVQAERFGYFRQAHRRIAGSEKFEHRKGAVERLQLINAGTSMYHIVRRHAAC